MIDFLPQPSETPRKNQRHYHVELISKKHKLGKGAICQTNLHSLLAVSTQAQLSLSSHVIEQCACAG